MRSLALVLLGLLIIMPIVAGQGAVNACSRQCAPRDADVNGDLIRRGTEPVQVVLYAHFEDLLQSAPLNAQPPNPDREGDLNRGFPLPVVDVNTGTPADVHFKNNEFVMFSSPGLVEYQDNGWRVHQEPGLASELRLVDAEITLYWYMSAHALPMRSSASDPSVGAMPQVAVYARLETGRFPHYGKVIAESLDFDQTNPPSPQRVNMIALPGQPDVYQFEVKLKVKQAIIPDTAEAAGFVLYVNPYQIKTDSRHGVQVAQEQWRLRTGPSFPARLIMNVQEPMRTRASSMNLFDDRLYVRWSFVSALGSYDMQDAEVRLRSIAGHEIPDKAIDLVNLKKSIDHDGHFKPVNATWAIDYVQHRLPDGEYEVLASIPNLQGTYLLEQPFRFTVKDGLPQVPMIGRNVAPGMVREDGLEGDSMSTPGAAPALLLVGVLLAVGVRRRHQ